MGKEECDGWEKGIAKSKSKLKRNVPQAVLEISFFFQNQEQLLQLIFPGLVSLTRSSSFFH